MIYLIAIRIIALEREIVITKYLVYSLE